MPEPTLDGGFQGLRYLSALLNIARSSGMLESKTPQPSLSVLNKTAKPATDLSEISQPRPGALLIAHPCLPDWFSRTVVLLCDHSPDTTTLGLCLNKPWGGNVLDLVDQGQKAGAGNLGLDLSSSSSSGGGGGSSSAIRNSNRAFSSSNSLGRDSASDVVGIKDENVVHEKMKNIFGGRKKRNGNSSTDKINTSPRLLEDNFPLRNSIALDDMTEGSSDYDSSSEIELLEQEIEEEEEEFSSDFSGDDEEGSAQLRSRDLEKYLDEKENGIVSDDEDKGSLLDGVEEEDEDEEEEQRRERLFEALNLFSSGDPASSSSFSSSLGSIFNADPSDEGFELVFETDDEETMKLLAAAAHALTEMWDQQNRDGEGHIPGSEISDISVLSKEAMDAIDQLVDGPQKEAFMSMMDALGTTHKRVVASTLQQQQQREEEETEEEKEESLILPFALPPPDEEEIPVASALRIHGGRATFSAAGRRRCLSSSGGAEDGDDNDKSTISTDDAYTESPGAFITPHSMTSSCITPKELMAMSPRSQVYLGGPLPGVSVLHTRGSALGGKAILGDLNSDRVVMFGTDATIPKAAAALAPQDQINGGEDLLAGDGGREPGGKAMSPEQLRFYLGSSHWAPNQLQQELVRGSWTMIQLDSSVAVDVFEALCKRTTSSGKPNKTDPSEAQAEAWQKVLAMASPAHAALAAVPESAWQELQELEI